MGCVFTIMKRAILGGKVNVPRRPHGQLGMRGVIGCLAECVTAIQQLRDRPVFYDAGRGGGGGGSGLISFKLSTETEGEDVKYKVSSERSTITDGTNGPALDLSPSSTEWASGALKFDTLSAAITDDTWVVLEADVDEDFLITDWTLAAKTTAEDAKEVGFNDPDPGDPVFQNKVRLIIGKIEFEDDVPSVTQATTQPQMIVDGLLNGKFVKLFTPAPLAL